MRCTVEFYKEILDSGKRVTGLNDILRGTLTKLDSSLKIFEREKLGIKDNLMTLSLIQPVMMWPRENNSAIVVERLL